MREERGRSSFFSTPKKTFFKILAVVFYARSDAEDAVKYLSGAVLDERPIRVDFDWGFVEGRQYGRCVLPKGKNQSSFFWGGGFFRSSWTPFLAHLCLPSSLLPSPSLPPSLSFPLKKKIAGDPAARSGTSTGTATIRAGAGGARWCARRSSSSSSRRPAAEEEEGETTTASGCEFRFFVFG